MQNETENLVDLTHIGLVTVDLEGHILEANTPFLKQLGKPFFSDIGGKPLSDFAENEAKTILRQALHDCQTQGVITNLECVFITPDGQFVSILINAYLNQSLRGSSISVLCKDINAIQPVETPDQIKVSDSSSDPQTGPAALFIIERASEAADRSYSTGASDDLHLAFISNNIRKITGYSERDFLVDETLWLNRIHLDDIKMYLENYRLCLTGNSANIQYRFQHKNGDYRWLNETLVVQRDADGAITRAIGSLTDATDWLLMQEQVKKLRSVVEQSPCPIFITDTNGIIEYANPRLIDLTGFSQIELIGRSPKIFSSEHTEISLYHDLWRHITNGKKWYGTIRNKKKNGQYFWVKESIAPIKNCRNEITHFIAIQEDISTMIHSSEKLEEQLKRNAEKIKLLEEQRSEQRKSVAIGRMAAWVAHEINNPLAGIKNSFQLLKSTIPEHHRYFRYVDMIDKEIDRISLITKQLYSLYRPEDAAAHTFDCNNVIAEIIMLCTSGKPKVKIDHVSAQDTCNVTLQENLIRQIFFNLIKNAIDHSPENETITINATKNNQKLVVIIENAGTFIPDDQLPRLLEPFYSTKSGQRQYGLGLGLTIVNSLVKLIHGNLKLINKESGGLIIELIIPLNYYDNN